MAELFPDDEGVRRALIQWHLASGDTDGAEAVLRRAADAAPAGRPRAGADRGAVPLRARGRAMPPAPSSRRGSPPPRRRADPLPFRRALAGLDFSQGRSDEAIAALTRAHRRRRRPPTACATSRSRSPRCWPRPATTRPPQALLAGVLAADPAHVAALKLHAKMAIDADRPETAVEDMRTALAQAPRDPEIMTIMALAHERQGSRELAGERLALAVEYSDKAPAESLRYARFLMQDNRTDPAEGVVVDALRRAPENPELLEHARPDPPRPPRLDPRRPGGRDPAQAGHARLRAPWPPRSRPRASRARASSEETIALLEELAAGDAADGGDARALAGLMQAYVAAGDLARGAAPSRRAPRQGSRRACRAG